LVSIVTINFVELDQDEQSSSTTSMRQKENLETFLESLLMMDDPGYKSESTHTSLPPMSRFPPTNETLNSNLLSQDIIEIKTLLVKVKTLLEKESQEDLIKVNDCEQDNERRILEDEIAKMKSLLSEKDQKIEQLEKIINSKKENVSTQTRRTQALATSKVSRSVVSSAKSLHNISISHVASPQHRPCQHSWGPCANDHTYHHARSRPTSPWSPASSSSSGSFHVDTKFRRIAELGRYKKRALSADLLNNNNNNDVQSSHQKSSEKNDHKISIYVTHRNEKKSQKC